MSDVKPVAYELHKARPNGDPVFGFCSASEVHSYTEDHWDIHAPLYSQATIDALQAEIEALRKDAERSAIAVARMELIIDMCNADEEVCDEFQGVAELIAFKCQVSLEEMKDECAVDLLDVAIAKEKQQESLK